MSTKTKMIPPLRNLIPLIAEDFRANGSDWTRPGFRALAVYRFGVWRMSIDNPIVRKFLSAIYWCMFRHCRNVYGIELPYSAHIGRGVVIEHQGGIVIHGASVIGDRCIIRQNCTLGLKTIEAPDDAPVLDEGVSLGAGAAVLGRIRVGAFAVIGANAVVISDIPARSAAVGVPAYVVRRPEAVPVRS